MEAVRTLFVDLGLPPWWLIVTCLLVFASSHLNYYWESYFGCRGEDD